MGLSAYGFGLVLGAGWPTAFAWQWGRNRIRRAAGGRFGRGCGWACGHRRDVFPVFMTFIKGLQNRLTAWALFNGLNGFFDEFPDGRFVRDRGRLDLDCQVLEETVDGLNQRLAQRHQ